jgi:hypothetical protein
LPFERAVFVAVCADSNMRAALSLQSDLWKGGEMVVLRELLSGLANPERQRWYDPLRGHFWTAFSDAAGTKGEGRGGGGG